VAKVLVDYGIRVAIMNACRSSALTTGAESDAESSFAQVLIASGIAIVLGMSYNISEGGALEFVHQFYQQLLLHNRSLADSASGARAALSKNRKRNARFGLVVEVDDWIIPSLYVRNLVTFKWSPSAHQKQLRGMFSGFAGYLGQGFASGVLSGVEQLQERFRLLRVTAKDIKSSQQVFGRDFDIYTLENTFLLPFLRKDRPPINRRIIHLQGLAGVGKTALLRHLLTWWKATHLVSESIYCDFTTLKSTADVLSEIKKQLFGSSRNASNLTMETVSQTLKEKRHLLVLDHLDAISTDTESDMTRQLAPLISALASGETFMLTASRNLEEGWLPNGTIWPLSLGGLAPQAAVQLIKAAAELDEEESQRLESRKETEALTSLVDLCEGIPAALEWIGAYLKHTKLEPSAVLRMTQKGEIKSTEISKPSRLGKDIDDFFASLTSGITSFDMNSFTLFGTVIGLLPFQKRAPKDFEISYLYTNWKMCEGTPLDWARRFGAPLVYVQFDLTL
jgi:NB-ARC domain/CHAT domain